MNYETMRACGLILDVATNGPATMQNVAEISVIRKPSPIIPVHSIPFALTWFLFFYLLPSELPPNNKAKHHLNTTQKHHHLPNTPVNHKTTEKTKRIKRKHQTTATTKTAHIVLFFLSILKLPLVFFIFFSFFCLIKLLFVVQLSTQTSNPVM